MNQIKFVALGGLDEVGKNCYIVEINNSILIFNSGYKLPEYIKQVSEYVICSIDYLEINKNRIIGLFISNIKKSQLGAIAYIANTLNLKIYASSMAAEVINNCFHEINELPRYQINIIKNQSKLVFKNFEIYTFLANSCSLENFIFAIYVNNKLIWIFNDSILDADLIHNNYLLIKEIVKFCENKETLLLICDSTNASLPEFTSPKHKISPYLNNYFHKYKNNRIIISCYDDDIYYIVEILKEAYKIKKPVYVLVNKLEKYIQKFLAKILSKDILSNVYNIDKLDNNDNNLLIIVSDEGKNLFNLINQIALNDHALLKFCKDDVFISAIMFNSNIEVMYYSALSEIAKHPIKVISLPYKLIRTMHPSQEDLKLFFNIVQPKYLIPIQGLYKDLLECSNFFVNNNLINVENTFVLDNGEMVIFEDNLYKKKDLSVSINSVFVNAEKIDSISEDVVNEKIKLGINGIVYCTFQYDKQNLSIISKINLDIVGFSISNQDYLDIYDYVCKVINDLFQKFKAQKSFNEKQLETVISNKISEIVKKDTGKTPKVVLNILI